MRRSKYNYKRDTHQYKEKLDTYRIIYKAMSEKKWKT